MLFPTAGALRWDVFWTFFLEVLDVVLLFGLFDVSFCWYLRFVCVESIIVLTEPTATAELEQLSRKKSIDPSSGAGQVVWVVT